MSIGKHFDLKVTAEECQFLCDVLASVGGDMVNSRRRYETSVSEALSTLGFKHNFQDKDHTGSIFFNEDKPVANKGEYWLVKGDNSIVYVDTIISKTVVEGITVKAGVRNVGQRARYSLCELVKKVAL